MPSTTPPLSVSAFTSKMEKIVADKFENQLGVSDPADFSRLAFAKHAFGAVRMSDVPQEVKESSPADLDIKLMNIAKGKDYSSLKFQTSGSFVVNDFTTQIDSLITEDPDYGTSLDQQCYMDDVIVDRGMVAKSLKVPVYAAAGGLMESYELSAGIQEIKKLDYRIIQATGQRYGNAISFDEESMLFSRLQGSSNLEARGASQIITRNLIKLYRIRQNRKQLLKANVITGTDTVLRFGTDDPGVMSYNIPAFNQLLPVSGVPWGTVEPDGNTTSNAGADMLSDLNYVFNAYPSWLSAQHLLLNGDVVMNPRTMKIIMENPTIAAKLITLNVPPGSPVSGYAAYQVNTAIKSLIPSFMGRFIVDRSTYLLEDSSVAWNVDGGETWGDAPEQKFFFPDGYLFFRTNVGEGPIGEMLHQPALQNGGITNPGSGDWVAFQDMSGPTWAQGMTRPRGLLTAGFQAGVLLKRPVAMKTMFVL